MQNPKKSIVNAVIFLSTANLIANLIVIFGVQDPAFRAVFTDLTFPLGGFLATGALFHAAWQWKSVSPRRFYAWLVLAISYLVFTIGDVIWAVMEVGLKQSPFPSPADWCYVAYYPLFLFGILLLPAKRLSWAQWVKSGLDAAIILIASVVGIWIYVIGPTIQAEAGAPLVDIILSVLYPVGDILIMAALLRLLYLQQEGQRDLAMLLIAACGAFTIFIDTSFSLQTLTDTYVSGGALDIGWLLAYYLIMLAGVWEVVNAGRVEKSRQDLSESENQARWVTYLPYLWIVAAYALLIYGRTHDLVIRYEVIIYSLGILIGLALVRQVIMIEENFRLTGGLQIAIRQGKRQEAALAQSNRALESEIEVRKNVEEQLLHTAFHDPLTGLPNRALFLDHLNRSFEYARRYPDYRFSVIFMDLDDFKLINDSMGHPFGDRLLVALARKIEALIRSSDIISRFGGDEFIFLIEDGAGPDSIVATANRILEMVSTPFELDGNKLCLSASMGIVSYHPGYQAAEELLQDADIAMYNAKAHGKGNYEVFHTDMRLQPRPIDR